VRGRARLTWARAGVGGLAPWGTCRDDCRVDPACCRARTGPNALRDPDTGDC
jgi:hypothetical protein